MKGRGSRDPDAGREPGGRRSASVPNRKVEDRADYGRATGQFERRTDRVHTLRGGSALTCIADARRSRSSTSNES
jgi:hypothetical protein